MKEILPLPFDQPNLTIQSLEEIIREIWEMTAVPGYVIDIKPTKIFYVPSMFQ